MLSKFPQDGASNDEDDNRSTVVEIDADEVISIHCDKLPNGGQSPIEEPSGHAPGAVLGANTAQMAYLQLMTQKVMDAVANNPDVLKIINSAIRNDQDK